MEAYSKEIEENMNHFYESLSEKDRRHYVAVEAERIGHGGVTYIAELFNCSRQTIYDGIGELKKKNFPSPQE